MIIYYRMEIDRILEQRKNIPFTWLLLHSIPALPIPKYTNTASIQQEYHHLLQQHQQLSNPSLSQLLQTDYGFRLCGHIPTMSCLVPPNITKNSSVKVRMREDQRNANEGEEEVDIELKEVDLNVGDNLSKFLYCLIDCFLDPNSVSYQQDQNDFFTVFDILKNKVSSSHGLRNDKYIPITITPS